MSTRFHRRPSAVPNPGLFDQYSAAESSSEFEFGDLGDPPSNSYSSPPPPTARHYSDRTEAVDVDVTAVASNSPAPTPNTRPSAKPASGKAKSRLPKIKLPQPQLPAIQSGGRVLLVFMGVAISRILAAIHAIAAKGTVQTASQFVALGLWAEMAIILCFLVVLGRAMYSIALMETAANTPLARSVQAIAWAAGGAIFLAVLVVLAGQNINLVLAPASFALLGLSCWLQNQQRAAGATASRQKRYNIHFWIYAAAILAPSTLIALWVHTLLSSL